MSSNTTQPCDPRGSTTATVVLTICYCALTLAVLVGNILIVLVVYKNKNMRKTVNWFILNMAMSDLLVPFVFVLPEVMSLLTRSMKWRLEGVPGDISCKLVHFLADVSPSVSTFSIVLISLERFIAVVFPMRVSFITNKVRIALIMSTWITAAGLASPYFYTFRLAMSSQRNYIICTHFWEPAFDSHHATEKRYRIVLYAIGVMLPFVLLCFFYICILVSVRRHSASTERQDGVQRRQRERENSRVTRTAVAIVGAFAICFGPVYVFNFIQVFVSNMVKIDYTSCSIVVFYNLVKILLCLDGALNPLICFVFLNGYRRSLKLICSRSPNNYQGNQRHTEASTV